MPIDRLFSSGKWLHQQLADGVLRERYEYAAVRITHRWLIAARRELVECGLVFLEIIDEEDCQTFPGRLTELREAVRRTKNALEMAMMMGFK